MPKKKRSLISRATLAEALNCSERTILRLVKNNAIPHYRLNPVRGGPQRLRFDLDEVRAVLRAKTKGTKKK